MAGTCETNQARPRGCPVCWICFFSWVGVFINAGNPLFTNFEYFTMDKLSTNCSAATVNVRFRLQVIPHKITTNCVGPPFSSPMDSVFKDSFEKTASAFAQESPNKFLEPRKTTHGLHQDVNFFMACFSWQSWLKPWTTQIMTQHDSTHHPRDEPNWS